MRIKALKYGLVFLIPFGLIHGIYAGGWYTFAVPIYAFVVIPLLELLFKPDGSNASRAELEMRKKDRLYDWMLYAIVPLLYLGLFLFLRAFEHPADFSISEKIGLIFSMGILCGALGINVAHELGHRPNKTEQTLSKLLLLPSLYMHFFIEHNRGHHRNVSTPEDPASARRGESVYQFWIRSVIFSYIHAWQLEFERLGRKGYSRWSWQNEMMRFTTVEILFLIGIYLGFGLISLLAFLPAAIVGFLMLETVNYIEHYGLRRSKASEFRYERTLPEHSWNSNYVIGRLMLFELSRHSDHHYKASKKYQLLEHHDESPQMPTGYPGMMLLSLIPPLWFRVMDPLIPKNQLNLSKHAA